MSIIDHVEEKETELRIPWLGYKQEYEAHREAINGAIQRVIESGAYQRSEEVDAFEREFAEYCDVKHGIGTNSCYAAMLLSLLACGVGPGDEVITVPNTDITTTAAISHTGAQFVWADIDERTYNIDPRRIEEKITERTKAILPVHLYGLPADMDALMSIAKAYGLWVITDNALAVGARYRGKRRAAIGDIGCFSFVYGKGLGTYGDAGMVVTDDAALAERIRRLNLYHDGTMQTATIGGIRLLTGFHYESEGYYTRLIPLHAAILREKLKVLDSWVVKRRKIAQLYAHLLGDLDLILPYEPDECGHVYRNYTLRVKKRDYVRRELAKRGIETGLHYVPPLHLQPVYSKQGDNIGDFPITERVANELITLPMYPELTEGQIQEISKALHACIPSKA